MARKTGSPEPPPAVHPRSVILLIGAVGRAAGVVQRVLAELAGRKSEFRQFSVEQLTPPPNQPLKLAPDLNRTALIVCEHAFFSDVAGLLMAGQRSLPVFVVVDRYRAATIDDVFQKGYLYTRGIFKEDVGDAEDVGTLCRALKEELRGALASEGKTVFKQVGWKVTTTPADREQRRLVTLFADPVMREFMQQLIFTVTSIRVEMPKRSFTDQGLVALFQRIHEERHERKIEEEARSILARAGARDFRRPPPILLEGETGTGKTVVAGWIRRFLSSPQSEIPLERVSTVNVGAAVLEAELFGVIPGTFTGAVPRPGRLLLAGGGIVFLDEIGDLTPEVQAKFLVYLDDLEFQPDGWPYSWKVFSPAYVIAATNKDLKRAVERGEFRLDLYHRFVHRLRVPSLRERRGDLRPLIDLVLQDPSINAGLWVEKISLDALARLEGHEFPGNFRELESALSHAVFRAVQAGRKSILAEDLDL